jgi:hypothetical protein
MKKNNFKSFPKKSHNQKIHDAHVLRTHEKEAAKQVIDFIIIYKNFIYLNLFFRQKKRINKQLMMPWFDIKLINNLD